MKPFRITCENGYSYITDLSDDTTLQEAEGYFLGSSINTTSHPKEILSKVTSVQELGSVQCKDEYEIARTMQYSSHPWRIQVEKSWRGYGKPYAKYILRDMANHAICTIGDNDAATDGLRGCKNALVMALAPDMCEKLQQIIDADLICDSPLKTEIEDMLFCIKTGTKRYLSSWLKADGGCAMRVQRGSVSKQIGDRVAVIEKTPRVRIAPFTIDDEEFYKWEYGPKGDSDLLGSDQTSHQWCDNRLRELGYILPEDIKNG